ncbi:MAG: diguanylate cyclase [Campylobacterales bacterium]|nr:diguanylate cyclase [Campylobacterales bacterium]
MSEGRPSNPSTPVPSGGISFIPVLKKVSFDGAPYLIMATLNTDYLANRYDRVLPPEEGAISLWRMDGVLLFSTSPDALLGTLHYTPTHPKDAETIYDHFIRNKHMPLDVIRLGSVMPFVVEVSMNESIVLGYWDKERSKVLWVSVMLVALSGLLALVLVLRYYRESQRQRQQLAYEKQFRIAMEATQTGVWTWDYVNDSITWDPQCYALLGYEPDVFTPSLDAIKALTHPEESVAMFLSIQEQIILHQSFLVERRMRSAQGAWMWVQVRGKVIEFTPQGKPRLLTGVYINVDAQKKAEELHLLAVAFETQEAILIADANEVIVKVNEAFTRITGYLEEEVLGRTPRMFKSSQHDAAFYAQLWKALREEGFWQGEMWNKRKNGEIYAEHLTTTAIRNEAGEVNHYLANFNDITTHKVAQKKIQDLAYRDPLTHLANRTVLDEALQKALARQGQYGAVIFLDLDCFKELNDTYGHDAGDMLLIQVANRLQDATRQHDTVARLGGDEFVVLLENLGEERVYAIFQARAIAQKLLARLCEPYALAHGNHTLGVSIGFALFDEGKEPQEVLKEADMAMYQAKERGRKQIFSYEKEGL